MKYLVFDTETTGLLNPPGSSLENPRIIELAIVIFDTQDHNLFGETDPQDIIHFSQVFDPERQISPDIMRITGLTNSDLEGKPKIKDMAEEIQSYFLMPDIIAAHNLTFDLAMLSNDFLTCARTLQHSARLMCTVEETEWFKGYRLNLQALHEYLFGEKQEKWHRAMDDVQTTKRCILEMVKRDLMPGG